MVISGVCPSTPTITYILAQADGNQQLRQRFVLAKRELLRLPCRASSFPFAERSSPNSEGEMRMSSREGRQVMLVRRAQPDSSFNFAV